MNRKTKLLSGILIGMMALSLSACVDQHPEKEEPDAVSEETRIVATSNATLQICDRLDLDLVAIPTTSGEVPKRYQDLPEIGTAMAPDAEKIALLEPTDIIGPAALSENLESVYQGAGVPYTFIDLQSVEGMYESIEQLGEKYHKEDKAEKLIKGYEKEMKDFQKRVKGKEAPKVLVLMGLPGSYIECTPHSYVGSLVELAGAECVADDEFMNFVSWNTEELLKLDPDIILLTAHGLPDLAMDMFTKEFHTNDIWQHFRAVQEGHVYQLDYNTFGMSCNFTWPKALNTLEKIFYGTGYESYDTTPMAEEEFEAQQAEQGGSQEEVPEDYEEMTGNLLNKDSY